MAKMIIICMSISIILLLGTYILNRRETSWIDKRTTIESGFESIDEKLIKQHEYYLPFFIIGILFIIFDLEAVLLYPFANLLTHYMFYYDLETSTYTTILIYIIFVLFVYFIIYGLYYEYTKDVL